MLKTDDPNKPKVSHDWLPEEIRDYYDKYLKILSSYSHTSRAEFVELLVETCLAEKNLHEGLVDFLSYVKQEGLEIQTEQDHITKNISRFSDLRFLRKLIWAMGLQQWEDDIIKAEIQRIYRPPTPGIQPGFYPTPKGKE
jgi:hypothetical protein